MVPLPPIGLVELRVASWCFAPDSGWVCDEKSRTPRTLKFRV